MGFKLSNTPAVRYSPAELRTFAILAGARKPLLTTEVSKDFFGEELPFHADTIVRGNIRSLQRKIAANREPFKVERVKVDGVRPVGWKLTKVTQRERAVA